MIVTRLRLHGGRSWVQNNGSSQPLARRSTDHTLVRGLRDAHRMIADLGADPELSALKLSYARAAESTLERLRTNLALLAPAVQAAILDGDLPQGATLEQLSAADMPLAWVDQARHLHLPT